MSQEANVQRRKFILMGLATSLSMSVLTLPSRVQSAVAATADESSLNSNKEAASAALNYRPLIHYAPGVGFMNDPNGLIFFDGEYHLFYQTNPYEMHSGRVHWGHAVSSDLLHWEELPLALNETNTGQAFSGSMIWDKNNSSGFFDQTPGALVSIYTRSGPTKQTQELAYSTDKGRTFSSYENNPVLDINSDSFRDPKVFWHEPTQRWIMVLSHSREHEIGLYASSDLKQWESLSRFGKAGWVGIDYECPDLVEVPVEGGGSRWVLFVSINPGAPLGGSAVQYFVGDFDGKQFTPSDRATRMMDFGPDFYALQSFSGISGEPLALAWANNWLYSNIIPAEAARGMMSLPRHLRLRQTEQGWALQQRFIALDDIAETPWVNRAFEPTHGLIESIALPENTAVELKFKIKADENGLFLVRFTNDFDEALDIGFDSSLYAGFFVDRGSLQGFKHHYFTERAIAALPINTRETDMHIVFDRSLVEFLGQEGQLSATFLHFFAHPPARIELIAQGDGKVTLLEAQVRALKPTVQLLNGKTKPA